MDIEGAVLLTTFGLGIVRFWPSARGHWSGPLLALPSVFVGLALAAAIIRESGRVLLPAILVICPVYIALGVASILLWKWRAGSRNEKLYQKDLKTQ